jgi:hypothetical protein
MRISILSAKKDRDEAFQIASMKNARQSNSSGTIRVQHRGLASFALQPTYHLEA